MFGLENITAKNGWAMAVVGASTVFLGLVVLSFVISQIHKFLEMWEQRDKYLNRFRKQLPAEETPKMEAPVHKERHLPAAKELANIYRPLVQQLKEPFQLTQLYEKTKHMDLPHPHLSIKRLQEAGILVAEGDGTFTWNKQKQTKG